MLDVEPALQLDGFAGELAVVDQRTRARRRRGSALLGHCKAPVERHRDEAGLGAGEEGLRDLGRVGREDRDALSGLEPELLAEPVGEAVGAALELRERQPPAVRDVDDRVAARRPPGVASRQVADVDHRVTLYDLGTTMPSASRSTVSGVIPSLRSLYFWMRWLGVFGRASTIRT